jgi:acetaldehyde dehydrogenase (acetylating)
VTRILITPQRLPNPALVGRAATYIAEKAGIKVPSTTRVLVAPLAGVGRDFPLSIEKLCPVLSWYVVDDWRAGCERCKEILRYGGMGHTMSVHSRNDQIVLEFGLKKPAYRIVVNTPTTHGSVGLTTGLDPAMTLGCGGWGGNITSDNISPKHLLNIKRVAYETQPAKGSVASASDTSVGSGFSRTVTGSPATPPRAGLNPDVLGPRIDQFLASRGIPNPEPGTPNREPERGTRNQAPGTSRPAEFVCEEDVRQALRAGVKIVLDSRTIVTPAARDLGDEKHVFVDAR